MWRFRECMFIFFIELIIRARQFGMWQNRRHKQEEGFIFMLIDKGQGFGLNERRRIGFFFDVNYCPEVLHAGYCPIMGGVIAMRLALAIVAKELIKSFTVRIACGAHHA